MNKTAKRILYIIIAVLILAVIVYPKLPKSEVKGTSDQAIQDTPLLTVNAVVLNEEPLKNEVKVTGSLIADESVALNTELAGKVEFISFQEGERVKKGTVLLALNDDEILAEIEKLQFTKKLNESNENRQKQLLDKEAISREEYENSLTSLNTIKSEIKVLQARLAKHYLKAPFDGVIGLRDISEGGYLNPGTRVADLYKIDPIKLEFAIPSKYISLVNKGDKINFSTDAYEDMFYGEIYAIEPQIDPETRSIRIRASSENTDGKHFPGQFARITLILQTIPNAILIPTEAVIPELSGKKVFIYKNGKSEPRQVTTGIRTDKRIQVTEGLSKGDTVITSGILQVSPGMEVNVNIN
ncbi:MAG: membrane fusion protein (multidrug efflux system) [Marinoscillum sp.]|jgi:membrane fusion protein (multidrug efflux system)